MNDKLVDSNEIQYASFDRRMIASSIDIVIITIILYPLMGIVNYILYRGGTSMEQFFTEHGQAVTAEDLSTFILQEHLITKWIFIQMVVFLIMAAYFIYFWSYKGATPGKLLVKCRVIDLKTNKTPALKQCIGRFFSYILSVLPILIVTGFILYSTLAESFRNWYIIFIPLSCIGFFIQTLTKKRQALHDIVSNTAVIRIISDRKKKLFIL